MDELPGKTFGPYLIVEKIAEGGMAVVYKGYQESLRRYVAIKVLRKELTADHEFVTRFRREALAAAKLSHPSILPIYDASVAQGGPSPRDPRASPAVWHYIAMEYVDGGSLKDLIARGPLPIERALSLCAQLADALDYAHRQGLVHRDVKPANVLMTRSGRPMLTDFGIAKALHESTGLTHAGTSIGTPMYMAPEQAEGRPSDGRTDVYALGIVLYEMLTGHPPFTAAIPLAILYQQMNDPPPKLRQVNPNIPLWLEAAVNTALAKRPADRYQQACEFAEVLRQRRTPIPPTRTGVPEVPAGGPAYSVGGPAYSTGGPAYSAGDVRRQHQAKALPPKARHDPRRVWNPVSILLAAVLILLLAMLGGGLYLFLGNPAGESTPAASMTETPVPTPPTATAVVLVITLSAPTPTPARLGQTPTNLPTEPLPPSPEPATPTLIPSPTLTDTPTATPMPSPAPTRAKPVVPTAVIPTSQPGVITNFEVFGTWRRGNEPNGTFTQSSEQSHSGSFSGKLAYDFRTPDNDYVVFEQKHSLAGQPQQITAWVYGDGSGHFLNVWIKDSANQVWQVPLGRISHTGWAQMIGTLDVNQAWPWSHISGSDNGQIDYPVSFQALVLDDRPDPFVGAGTVYIDDLGTSPIPSASTSGRMTSVWC